MKINVKGAIVQNADKWIYDWFGIDATSPKDVSDALEKANGMPVDVEINSGGGDIFAGSEIYTALRSYAGGVNIRIVGLCASAASVIAMAGKSEMSPTAMMMVHNVSSYAEGDYHSMDKQSDVLQQANKTIASAYVAKTGMTEKDALSMMDKETWLTAQQAVDKGLIDKVMFADAPQLAASFNSGLLPRSVIDKIRNQMKNPQAEKQAVFLQAKLNLLKVKVV
ncbi:head maturation protease, ClpP-related [Caproiciproducens sp.]